MPHRRPTTSRERRRGRAVGAVAVATGAPLVLAVAFAGLGTAQAGAQTTSTTCDPIYGCSVDTTSTTGPTTSTTVPGSTTTTAPSATTTSTIAAGPVTIVLSKGSEQQGGSVLLTSRGNSASATVTWTVDGTKIAQVNGSFRATGTRGLRAAASTDPSTTTADQAGTATYLWNIPATLTPTSYELCATSARGTACDDFVVLTRSSVVVDGNGVRGIGEGRGNGGSLPRTGVAIMGLVLAGSAAVVAGKGLTALGRRRQAA